MHSTASTRKPLSKHASPEELIEEAERIKSYEQMQALKEGRLPTTSQLVEKLEKAIHDPDLHRLAPELSSTGRTITEDTEHLLLSIKEMVEKKNTDEGIQRTLYHARRAAQLLEQHVTEPRNFDIGAINMQIFRLMKPNRRWNVHGKVSSRFLISFA